MPTLAISVNGRRFPLRMASYACGLTQLPRTYYGTAPQPQPRIWQPARLVLPTSHSILLSDARHTHCQPIARTFPLGGTAPIRMYFTVQHAPLHSFWISIPLKITLLASITQIVIVRELIIGTSPIWF